MFAVSSVDAAKAYYEEFQLLQKNSENPLMIATTFSFAAKEEQFAIGEIEDKNFDLSSIRDLSGTEFLTQAIDDYNLMFGVSYSVESKSFQDYYKDLTKHVKIKKLFFLLLLLECF